MMPQNIFASNINIVFIGFQGRYYDMKELNINKIICKCEPQKSS